MSDASNPSSPTRRSARVHHEVMVGVSSEAGTFSGWGTNLSVGGVFVNSHHAPPIDTRVQKYVTLEKVIVMLRREPGDAATHYLAMDLVFRTSEDSERTTRDHTDEFFRT